MITLAGSLPAQGAPRPIERARHLVRDLLDYPSAIRVLERARSRGEVAAEEEAEALELLAIAHVALGDSARAEQAFLELQLLDPAARIDPLLGPKVLRAFERAQETARPLRPELELRSAEHTGRSLRLVAGRHDPRDTIRSTELFLCPAGRACTAAPLPAFEQAVELPVPSDSSTVAYFLVARSRIGRVVATLGSERAPLLAHAALPAAARAAAAPDPAALAVVEPAPAEEWYTSTWLWVGVAVVAAAGVTAAVVLLREPEAQPSPGALFGVKL